LADLALLGLNQLYQLHYRNSQKVAEKQKGTVNDFMNAKTSDENASLKANPRIVKRYYNKFICP
jgi:hypothetical protein